MAKYDDRNRWVLGAWMSTRPWKDSADPDLFVWSYLSQDSTWHILRGHTFCSLNLYSWTIRNSYKIMENLSQAVHKSYWGHSWMGKGMEPIEQRADLKLRFLKSLIKMRSIELSHSFRIWQRSQRGCNCLPPSQFLSSGPGPAVPLFPPSGYIWSHMVCVTPCGLLGTTVLLLVPPNLLPGGVGLKAEGSLATTEQQLEHQCVISIVLILNPTAALHQLRKKFNCTPANSRTVDNTSLIIIAVPAITAELGGYTKYSDHKLLSDSWQL